jgi:heptaprenyl diphosphate synthase component 2
LTLFGPAAVHLDAVEAWLRKTIEWDPPEVGASMLDLFAAGGKRLRPALVLLSAMAGTFDEARVIPAAMALELTHAATLVHDDVIDRAAVRRGRPTVAAKLGDEPAIVIGDFYFAKAYEFAARTKNAEVVAVLARTVMAICAGEVRQQSIRYHYATDVDEYIQRVAAKTGMLVGASCEIGALLGKVGVKKRLALASYGQYLGVAFQIVDDVLDYVGSEDEVGKPLGQDLLEGFATLPLMLASVEIADKRLDETEARRIVEEVRRSDGPKRALQEATKFANRAKNELRVLASGEVTDALTGIADYVVSRKL